MGGKILRKGGKWAYFAFLIREHKTRCELRYISENISYSTVQ